MDSGPKGSVFLDRYLDLAHVAPLGGQDAPLTTIIVDLPRLWDCSERSARQTLRRLELWGLLAWHPCPGRARRSESCCRFTRSTSTVSACRAEAVGSLAEAAFWLGEVLASCPCIP